MTTVTNINKDRRTQQVAWTYLKMLLVGISLTGLAIIAASYLNKLCPLSEACKTIFEYFGYVCWVTSLGESGLSLLTWGGKSRAEVLDRRLAQIISLLGVFAFVFSRELKPM